MHYIYCYTCPIRNEYIYIGRGRGADNKRMLDHLLEGPRNKNKPLPNRIKWIKKHGQEPIIEKIVTGLDFNQAKAIETFWIKTIGRKDLGLGPLLNLTDGGEGFNNLGPGASAKKSAAMKAIWADPEKRAKRMVTKSSPEYKAKIKATLKKTWSNPEMRSKHQAATVAAMARPEVRIKLENRNG